MPRCRVTHFECVDWPDRGTPDAVEPILDLIQAAESKSLEGAQASTVEQIQSYSAPILVHCSAGVGRTGTLIAIASSVRRLNLLRHSCTTFATSSPQQRATVLSHPSALGRTELAGDRLHGLPETLDQDLVARTVDHLREQRVCMVQTDIQLGFVYKAVAKILQTLIYN
ncbi:hypothetical protein CROQUDRAFT_41733 [Cronartium quercuum f. sp. fusiforme G11]|uniref:Uncharacterized protein n=1 Tax=Cronartium quercuum f. sp. fusiforme G11 TaxID=708437 RepID=A0A9P6NMD9_9BASI|nr:hypothetical protein CROQUDRAFT_41733 [Cronartium quercuum f. sp. fusiforme G11]